MIYFDHDTKQVRLDLRASEALEILQESETNQEKYFFLIPETSNPCGAWNMRATW